MQQSCNSTGFAITTEIINNKFMLERNTIVSQNVMALFESSKHPLSANNIIQQLNNRQLSPNKATIYRILTKLKKSNIISEFSTKNGTSFFELNSHTHHHHHHFICNSCDTVFCLNQCHLDAQKINISALLPNTNFKVESHEFNIYGTCEPCASMAKK